MDALTVHLPPTLTLRYSWMIRLLPILGLGLVAFLGTLFVVQFFALPDAACWGIAILTLILFFPIWRLTGKSVIEASEEGLISVDWRGNRQSITWSEIAAIEYHDAVGSLGLKDAQGKRRLLISNQRNSFILLTFLLVYYCPHLWQPAIGKSVRATAAGWLFGGILLVISGVLLISSFQNGDSGWILALFFMLISGYFIWLSSGRLVVNADGIRVEHFLRQRVLPFGTINMVTWSTLNTIGTFFYTPILHLSTGKVYQLNGFGDSVTLFCTTLHAWLDAREQAMMVHWSE